MRRKNDTDMEELANLIGDKIKIIARELRQANGNKNITQNDMIWYLIHKTDATHEILINHIQDYQKTMRQFLTIEDFEKEKDKISQGKKYRIERIMSLIAILISVGILISRFV